MNRSIVARLGFCVACILLLVPSATVYACEVGWDDTARCESFRMKQAPPILPPSTPKAQAAKSAPAPQPVSSVNHGNSPADAKNPTDTWDVIDAGATVWYKVGNPIGRQHFEVWLDTNGKDGIGFAVYAPDQMGDLNPSTPPKGRGSKANSSSGHDLMWVGNAPMGGEWYVAVGNGNPVAVPYKLGSNRSDVGYRDCTGPYWEFLPDGRYILWPGFCK